VATAAELQIILTAKDSASQQIDGLGKSLGALGGVGKVAAVGLAGLATVGVGLAAGLASSITAAADFEAAMSGVGAVSGASATELAALSAKALQLGQDTTLAGIGATDAAAAMQALAAGGVSTQDILEGAAQGALLLASAGGIDVARAADIAANALNQFGLSGSQAGHVADLLAGAANASSADVGDLGESLKYVGPIAHSMGIGIEEVVATLAEFGSQGIKGSQAGTSLRSILASLVDPSKAAATTMKDLGLQFFDSAGHMKSIAGISEELKTKLSGLTDQQRAQALSQIFGNEALSAATILYGEGAAGIQKFLGQVDQAGSAAATGAKRNDNLKGSIEQLKSSLETASITLGMAFLPAVRGIVNAVGNAVNAAIPFIQQYGPVLVAALQAGIAVLAGFGQAVGQAALAVLGAFRAFASGQTTLAEFIGGMEIFVTTIRDKLAGLAVAAAPYIAQFFQAIAGAIAQWAPQIAAQFQLWARSFVDWIVTTAIPALGPPLAAFVAAIGAWITGTALPAIQAQVLVLAAALTDWVLTTAVPALQAALPLWVLAFATGLQAALVVVQQWAADLMVGIGGALNAILPLIQAFFAVFLANLPALQALWSQLIVVWGQALTALTPLAPAGEVLAAVLGGVLVLAVTGFLGILGALVGFLTGALPGAIQVASGLLTALGGVFQAVQAVIQGVVGVVSALIHGDWAGAWRAATQAANDFSSAVQTIFQGFVKVITGLIETFIGGAEAAWAGFVATTQGFFSALVSDSENQIGQMITSIVASVTAFIADTEAAVTAWVTAVVTSFTTLATDTLAQTTALVTTVTASIAAFIGNTESLVTGWVLAIANAFLDLYTQATGAVTNLVTEVDGSFTNLVGLVRLAMGNLSAAVISALEGLIGTAASEAASVGRAIADGIAGGISSGAGAIAAAARDAASAAFEAAKSVLGIHSPSKAFEYVGAMTVAGFARGITRNSGLVERALGGVTVGTPTVAGIATSAAPVGGGAVAGGGSVTYLITGNTVLSKDTATQQALSGIVTSAQRRTIGYSV